MTFPEGMRQIAEFYEAALSTQDQRTAIRGMIEMLGERIGVDGWTQVYAAEGNDRLAGESSAFAGGTGPFAHKLGLAQILYHQIQKQIDED